MTSALMSVLATLRGVVRSCAALHFELLALRHQVQVLQRSQARRLRLGNADRLHWAWLSHTWRDWRTALVIVKPETVVAWHRRISAALSMEESSMHGPAARVLRCAGADSQDRARESAVGCAADPRGELFQARTAGLPRDGGEVDGAPSHTTVPVMAHLLSQSCPANRGRRFLRRPTGCCSCSVILAHERCRVVHIAATRHPTAAWTA
jgi:hypothetical protein